MDIRCNKRICLTYTITFILLVLFFYHLMWSNRKNSLGLSRLEEEVRLISEALNIKCKSAGGSVGDPGSLSGNPQKFLACDQRELSDCVETILKDKISTLTDDVNKLKKQVLTGCCNNPHNAPALTSTRINYASEELGARIVYALAKPITDTNIIKTMLGLEFCTNPPINMLRSTLLPGACFGFRGSQATVSVRLAKVIIVDEISLTHVSKELTPSLCVNNAPKEFEVYGLSADNKQKELLGRWKYDNDPKKRRQTYIVCHKGSFRNLVFNFISNYGGNSTCVYRVEVFGKLT